MYSLVLMSALSVGPTVPEFDGYFRNLFSFRGCSGCNGCDGSASRSVGCSGCSGGGLFNGRILSFFRFNGGCCGSCCGGQTAMASCYGTSCNGGMMYTPTVPQACCGGGTPYEMGMPYGGAAPFTGPTFDPNMGVPYAPPSTAPPAPPETVPDSRLYGRYTPPAAAVDGRATVQVKLPADARLFAEDRPLQLDSATRTFVTPPLPGGREYTYRFRAEYDRNGRTVSETKRLVVRPGASVPLEFEDLTVARAPAAESPRVAGLPPAAIPIPMPAATTSAPARITVTLPPGGTLYIDKQKDERPDRVREYTTPPLPPGKEFAYWMTVETVANGQKEYVIQKVVCKAGESVPVDFTKAAPDRRASAR